MTSKNNLKKTAGRKPKGGKGTDEQGGKISAPDVNGKFLGKLPIKGKPQAKGKTPKDMSIGKGAKKKKK